MHSDQKYEGQVQYSVYTLSLLLHQSCVTPVKRAQNAQEVECVALNKGPLLNLSDAFKPPSNMPPPPPPPGGYTAGGSSSTVYPPEWSVQPEQFGHFLCCTLEHEKSSWDSQRKVPFYGKYKMY